MTDGGRLPEPGDKAGIAKYGKKALKRAAWKRGQLRYLLDSFTSESVCAYCAQPHLGQREMYDAIKSKPGEVFYLDLPRRRGKTYFLCVLAVEMCLSGLNRDVKYAAGTQKAIKKMVRPNLRKILSDCPEELRPKWNALDGEYVFPNGSVLSLAGCDNQNYENLRGTEAHLIIIDEAGFIDELDAVLDDVLMPQTLETNATVILSSTPPRSTAHHACEMMADAQKRGTFFHNTIYDNPRLTLVQIDNFLRKSAGRRSVEEFKKSQTFRREYLAEVVTDIDAAVIPEWIEKKDELVKEVDRPDFFDSYVGIDVGWRDGMAMLFAYWDFLNARLVIVDEWLAFKTTTARTVVAGKEKEKTLFGVAPEFGTHQRGEHLRVCDNALLTIADFSISYGWPVIPTPKDDKELQVNRLREWIAQGKVIVHPRCVNLIRQLTTTTWNHQHTSYERNADGHGDLVDALVYLCRNVNRSRNPYPEKSIDTSDMCVIRMDKHDELEKALFGILGVGIA